MQTTKKTDREKIWDRSLRQLSKPDQKRAIRIQLKRKTYRMENAKKDLDKAKKGAKEKGPHSYEAEVRVPQKTEEYRQFKTEVTNLTRRMRRFNLRKPKQ